MDGRTVMVAVLDLTILGVEKNEDSMYIVSFRIRNGYQ
jgi:hypothetical protein